MHDSDEHGLRFDEKATPCPLWFVVSRDEMDQKREKAPNRQMDFSIATF